MFRFFTVSAALVTGFYLTLAPAVSQQKISGKQDFTIYCAACHGARGLGNGPVATELKKFPADLTVLRKNNNGKFDRDKIAKIIDGRSMPAAHGTSEMPVWGYWFSLQATADGVLQEDRKGIEKRARARINRLVDYLETIQK